MSEQNTGATVVEAPPAAAPATEQPAVESQTLQPAAPETGLTRNDRRQRVREIAEGMANRRQDHAEAARQRALEQPRKEAGAPGGGQFTKEGEGGEESPLAPETAAASAPAGGTTDAQDVVDDSAPTTQGQAQTTPEGMVDIPLPDGHPWRDRGKTYFRTAKEFEIEARAGINAAMQNKEVSKQMAELERQRAIEQARSKVSGELPSIDNDPTWQEVLRQIDAAPGFGPEITAQIKEAFKAREELAVVRAEGQASREFSEGMATRQAYNTVMAEAAQVARIWKDEPWRVDQNFREYLAEKDRMVAAGQQVTTPTPQEFYEWLKPRYFADPRVKAEVQRVRQAEEQARVERIRAEERKRIEAEREAAAQQAAERRSTLPPTSRRTPVHQSTTPAAPPPQLEDPAPRALTHRERQAQAREIAQRYAPRR